MRSNPAPFLPLLLVLACGSPSAPPASPGNPPAPAAPATPGASTPRPPPARPAEGSPALGIASTAPVIVGTRQQLSATPPTVKGTLSWKSEQPAIAAVDSSGGVHGIAPGTATIVATVTYSDGTSESASTTVTVRHNPMADSAASRRHRGR